MGEARRTLAVIALGAVMWLGGIAPADAQWGRPQVEPMPLARPVYQDPTLVPIAAPVLMGAGVFVFGGFAAGTIGFAFSTLDLDTATDDTIAWLGAGLVLNLLIAGMGAYLAIGALTGDVTLHSDAHAAQWIGAVASMAGAIAWVTGLALFLSDDHFGDDSIGLMIGGGSAYLISLLFLVGIKERDQINFGLAPFPLRDGGGLAVAGSF